LDSLLIKLANDADPRWNNSQLDVKHVARFMSRCCSDAGKHHAIDRALPVVVEYAVITDNRDLYLSVMKYRDAFSDPRVQDIVVSHILEIDVAGELGDLDWSRWCVAVLSLCWAWGGPRCPFWSRCLLLDGCHLTNEQCMSVTYQVRFPSRTVLA